MSDYFPLLDLHVELLEYIAILSGAAGYFLCLVCKSLLRIRRDLFGRTREVLLEGNTKLINLLPGITVDKFSYAVQSGSLGVASDYLTTVLWKPVQVKSHHIKSVTMIEYLKEKGICVRNTGRYHSTELRDELISSGLITNERVSILERGTIDEVNKLANEPVDMYRLMDIVSGGTNHRERVSYAQKRDIGSAAYVFDIVSGLTEERLDWLKTNTKLDMDLVSYNLSSAPMLRWRQKNGLIVIGVNIKNLDATRLCLSMISDRHYRKWIEGRSIRCNDTVARMLLNFCKSRGLPHPRLVRFKHIEWLIDESY